MAKNLPCDPGDVGSIPGQGTKILPASGKPSLCALQLLSLSATTGESMGCNEDHVCGIQDLRQPSKSILEEKKDSWTQVTVYPYRALTTL